MDRVACVDIPFFSLQLLFRERPQWRELPAAVVDRDEAAGRILEVNEAARLKGVRPGLPYGQALSLSGELRAAVVSPALRKQAHEEILALLTTFTPEVEPCRLAPDAAEEPGTFWLNLSGLDRLYPSLARWLDEAVKALAGRGISAVISAGFTRFGSYVTARARRKSILLSSREQEERLVRRAPLRVLPLSAETQLLLERLGIAAVGSFLDLPEAGMAKRFGLEALRVFRWARERQVPVQPAVVASETTSEHRFDEPIGNLLLLNSSVADRIDDLLAKVARRQKLVGTLSIELFEEGELRVREAVRPAAPTVDGSVLKTLSRLRLSERRYEGAVDQIRLSVEEVDPIRRTGDLFASPRSQATESGRRALALIRARFGNEVVRRAVLHDEHLPEQSYSWEQADGPLFPRPPSAPRRGRFRLVRRLLGEPARTAGLPPSMRLVAGPFVVSGKWWLSEERREYYFARDGSGQLLWLYRDEKTGGWTLQGVVD